MKSPVVIAFALVLALVLGNPAHALIPHEHGDHHGAKESPVWQSLHAALRHEDKQALPVFSILVVLARLLTPSRVVARLAVETMTDSLFEYLRRGIVPHRKFG